MITTLSASSRKKLPVTKEKAKTETIPARGRETRYFRDDDEDNGRYFRSILESITRLFVERTRSDQTYLVRLSRHEIQYVCVYMPSSPGTTPRISCCKTFSRSLCAGHRQRVVLMAKNKKKCNFLLLELCESYVCLQKLLSCILCSYICRRRLLLLLLLINALFSHKHAQTSKACKL